MNGRVHRSDPRSAIDAGRGRWIAQALLVAVGALLVLAAPSPAQTPTPTREQYVAQAEPICQANTEANKRILKGVRAKVKQGKLAGAGRQFSRAATAFRATLDQVAAIPRPPADAATLGQWLASLRVDGNSLSQIGAALKAGDERKAQQSAVKLTRHSLTTNDIVAGFGFNYCRLDSSRFL